MAKQYIGLELGGNSSIRCVVIDGDARMLARVVTGAKPWEGVAMVLGRMGALVRRAVSEARLRMADIEAGGVAMPGPVDNASGVLHSSPNLPGWVSVHVGEKLTEDTGVPFFVENNANAAAWGEFWIGDAARRRRNMVLFTVGAGVGGAVIVDGRLLEGRDGVAGEIGHMCVKAGGRPCRCGAEGCVEAYASTGAIEERFRETVAKGWLSSLGQSGETVTSAEIFAAASRGDPVAHRVVARSGFYLGVAAATLANILNPECCLISGGLAQVGELVLEPMRAECRRRCHTPGRTMEILPASLGGDAALFGAAGRALERVRSTGESFP